MANDGAQRESIARAYATVETTKPATPEVGVQTLETFRFDFTPQRRDQLIKDRADVDQRLAESQARLSEPTLVLNPEGQTDGQILAHWTIQPWR